MSRYALTSAFALSLTLAACESADPAKEWSTQPPCPSYIAQAEAVRIAEEYAISQGLGDRWTDIRAGWQEAHWTIFADVTGKADNDLAMVGISVDGRVIRCFRIEGSCAGSDLQSAPRCTAEGQDIVSKQEATRIALDYLASQNIDHVDTSVHVSWSNAHWRVTSSGALLIDGHFSVFVSTDGTESELIGAFGSPSDDGVLRRRPKGL